MDSLRCTGAVEATMDALATGYDLERGVKDDPQMWVLNSWVNGVAISWAELGRAVGGCL